MRDGGLGVAAEQRRHPGLRDRGGFGHGQAAGPYELQGLVVREHTGQRRGGQFTDAVARRGADLTCHVLGGREELTGGQQCGGDQQGLGDGGVTDLVRVGICAVVDKVQVKGVGPGPQPIFGTGEVEPGSQEAGRLSALAGSDEYEHPHTLSCGRSSAPVGTGTKNCRGNCWGTTKV